MQTRKQILAKLKSNKEKILSFGVTNIGLFGSYVRDEQTAKSDIDILIDFNPKKETYDNFISVYDLLESIFKENKVEVVTKNGLSPYIGPNILNEVVYA